MKKYNPWPCGKPIIERPEPEQIREKGYEWDDPRDIVDIFEKKVAKFAGSKYAVAVDCCSHAIFLSLTYNTNVYPYGHDLVMPENTYVSVPQQILHSGNYPGLKKIKWKGIYQIGNTNVWDASGRWTKGMYIKDSLMCISFQIKKKIPIGRGGMILCDTKQEYDYLKLMSYDGRDLNTPYDSPGHVKMSGYHYYMTPEDAARGILLMDATPKKNKDYLGWKNYPKITKW